MAFSLLFRVLTANSVQPVLRFSALAVVGLGLAACATEPPPAATAQTQCEGERPQVCTMIYAPVCATHSDGQRQTHASACNACADDTVTGYLPGPCTDESTP